MPDNASNAQAGTPRMTSVTVLVEPGDGAHHHPNSVQVPNDTVLTLKWTAENAKSVRIDPLGREFEPEGLQQISTEDATFTLTALGEDGLEGTSWPLEVHTHDPAQVVSAHEEVNSGVARLVSFEARLGGKFVDSAQVGQELELYAVVSDGAQAVTIGGKARPLSKLADGNQFVIATVELKKEGPQAFECKVLARGEETDSASIEVDVAAGL